jgi:hypothetical protein
MRYDYKVVNLTKLTSIENTDKLEDVLDELGGSGYRPVDIKAAGGLTIFMRDIQEEGTINVAALDAETFVEFIKIVHAKVDTE